MLYIVIVASMDYTNWNSAERAGFEPAKPFWSLHTFQACAIDHSATSPNYLVLKFSRSSYIFFQSKHYLLISPLIDSSKRC